MPAYNFEECFADDVESLRKRQTIRAKRKHRPKPGQTSYCFTGMRTKKCRRLGAWPITRVRDITIFDEGVMIDGRNVPYAYLDAVAKRDGVSHWPSMLVWFAKRYGLPFNGDLTQW